MTSKVLGGKTYLTISVLEAAQARIARVFDDFERICVAFSGGKDSTILLHLAYAEAQRRGRELDVMFIDWEAQYQATIEHVETMVLGKPGLNVWWICLPITTSNESSVYEPLFTAWDPAKRDLWVREMPAHPCVISDYGHFPFYDFGMTFEDFVESFDLWYAAKADKTASFIGLRADEAYNRYRTIKNDKGRKRYDNLPWSTEIIEDSYKFYPIYDWRVEDLWAYIGKNNLPYNRIYDQMYLAGVSVHQMRVNEPYCLEGRASMDQYHPIEPATWAKMTQRTAGANFSARSGRTELFNHNRRAKKPAGMTWKEYSFLLLDSMPPPLRAHYWRRIQVFIKWFQDNRDWTDLKEESDPKLEAKKLGGSWRMVAHTLLKNDFFCLGLSFSINKDEYRKYYELVRQHEAGESLELPPPPATAGRRRKFKNNAEEIKRRYANL